jgi:hypothetical protein
VFVKGVLGTAQALFEHKCGRAGSIVPGLYGHRDPSVERSTAGGASRRRNVDRSLVGRIIRMR